MPTSRTTESTGLLIFLVIMAGLSWHRHGIGHSEDLCAHKSEDTQGHMREISLIVGFCCMANG
jgi:hypothetical protein